MRFYLVHSRRLDAKRVIMLNGGYRENLVSELWLMRHGEPKPVATPTVKAKDVKLRGRVKVRGYDCGALIG